MCKIRCVFIDRARQRSKCLGPSLPSVPPEQRFPTPVGVARTVDAVCSGNGQSSHNNACAILHNGCRVAPQRQGRARVRHPVAFASQHAAEAVLPQQAITPNASRTMSRWLESHHHVVAIPRMQTWPTTCAQAPCPRYWPHPTRRQLAPCRIYSYMVPCPFGWRWVYAGPTPTPSLAREG